MITADEALRLAAARIQELESKLDAALKEREWIIAYVRTSDADLAAVLAQRDDWHTTGGSNG